MSQDTEHKTADTLERLHSADSAEAIEAIRVDALGKKGWVSQLMKTLGQMSPEERQVEAPGIQGVRARIAEAIDDRKAVIEAAEIERRVARGGPSLPPPPPPPPRAPVYPIPPVI
ncbi:MAG: phenylalanine--tRNA ligase subunit alpha, partial [Qipengyuania sp.]